MISFIVLTAAVVVLPRMVDHGDSSDPRRTGCDLSALDGALDQFEADTGRLPTTAEGLNALLTAPPGLPGWHGPYLMHSPKDIWGRLYTYRILPSGKFEVRSAGPDGKLYTSDDIFQ